jgi:hypothetical protein
LKPARYSNTSSDHLSDINSTKDKATVSQKPQNYHDSEDYSEIEDEPTGKKASQV